MNIIKIIKEVWVKINTEAKHPVTGEGIGSTPLEHHSKRMLIFILLWWFILIIGLTGWYFVFSLPFLLVFKKILFPDRSKDWQTIKMYYKDVFSDFNQACIVWVLNNADDPIKSISIFLVILTIYIYTVYYNWSYP